jgi:HlyD family secretion protein
MRQQRTIIWSAIVLAVAALLALGLRPQPVLVETALVERAPLRVTIEEEGQARVKDRYIVSSPVSGFVRRIEWRVGDTISRDNLLTELEPLRSDVLDPRRRAEAEARVAASRSALLSAEEQVAAVQADADHAKSEYQRKQKLIESKVISEEELSLALRADQRSRAMLRSAKFAVDVARYELDAASTLLKYSAAQNSDAVLKERVAIRVPVNGSVLKVFRKSEGVVSAGAALIELGDPRALEVAVDVLSFDAVQIKAGAQVEISRWGGVLLQGIVRLVEPVGFTEVSALGVEEQRVWVVVDIVSDDEQWQSLGDGYRVEAAFILWQADDVLQVPVSSLFRVDDQWTLYIVEDGYAQWRQVELGQRNGLYAQIMSGVKEGERVIQHPDNALEEGSRVKLRR